MKIQGYIDPKKNTKTTVIQIPIEGKGGELGLNAVKNLVSMVDGLKNVKSESELKVFFDVISGYAMCCKDCAFLTDKSVDEFMQLVEHVSNLQLERLEK